MLLKATNQRSQAVAEFAIMGSLLLLVFGAIISYGQRYERMQETKMQAFRKALKASFDRNSPVNYTLRKENRGVDLFAFGRGTPLPSSGHASVMWQKGVGSGDVKGSYAFYEINNRVIELPRERRTFSLLSPGNDIIEQDSMVPASMGKELTNKRRTNYTLDDIRTEGTAGVGTQKTAVLDDTVETRWELRRDTSTPDFWDARRGVHERTIPNMVTIGTEGSTAKPFVRRAGTTTAVVNMDGAERNEIEYCDVNDPNCQAGSTITATRNWQTGN